jgi:drug/metabolite transporter (DMT)-like permease
MVQSHWTCDSAYNRLYSDLAISTRNIGATKASVLGVFEPITAILVGTLVFGEALTSNIITGILISDVAVTFMITVTKR